MKKDKRQAEDGFLQLLQRELKKLIIGAIIGAIALIGFILRDELSSVIKEGFFYGTVEVIIDDENIRKHSDITILNGSRASVRSFLLNAQSSVRLSSGNYIVQISYPKADGSKEVIFEEPLELKRREHRRISPLVRLPNTISVNLETPKERFVPEEQISFTVTSDKDGYLWLFSPDSKGNPNLFFPNESYADNHIEAGERYVIPPYGENSFALQTRDTPGEEEIVCLVTQSSDEQFALSCLKRLVPHVSLKITVTKETLWGYDRKIISIE